MIDKHLLDQIILTAVKLEKTGFKPLQYTNDLRTDLDDIYYTDLGFDLGEPVKGEIEPIAGVKSKKVYETLIDFLKRTPNLKDKEEYVKQKYEEYKDTVKVC